jgi:hypothetical protein
LSQLPYDHSLRVLSSVSLRLETRENSKSLVWNWDVYWKVGMYIM